MKVVLSIIWRWKIVWCKLGARSKNSSGSTSRSWQIICQTRTWVHLRSLLFQSNFKFNRNIEKLNTFELRGWSVLHREWSLGNPVHLGKQYPQLKFLRQGPTADLLVLSNFVNYFHGYFFRRAILKFYKT